MLQSTYSMNVYVFICLFFRKIQVSSLERRHTEREERLHMLVEALSKGRLNGALDDLMGDNNNQ